nr:hypothetical protein [Tanacetum cinerariifolium]
MQDDEPKLLELKEVIEVVTTAKLMTEVVTAATTITAAIIIVAPSAARRRKWVVIKDSEETATPSTIVHSEIIAKDKQKGILVEEPKPLKKQAQIEQDEAYARELEAELNKNINWDDAKKNMVVYLKNMASFKIDFFKGMSYDDIRPIFEKYFNSNVAFLEKSKEELEEEASKALKRTSESFEEKAAKKQKLDEEVEELKKHLQIIPNDDNDVYTEATPLALKVPVVDYEIHTENNKPHYKIIRADETHQLFLSFLSLLRNFDREDLEMLWQLVQERFASSKQNNFSDRHSWFRKSQKLEIVRVMWSAYHNIYNYIDDLTGRGTISINKVHFRSDAQQWSFVDRLEAYWCNRLGLERVRIEIESVGLDATYETTWNELKKMMIEEYYSGNEVKKMETELWNLAVKGTDIIGYTKRTNRMAHDLVDQVVRANVATDANNKRKWEDDQERNSSQKQNKRVKVGGAYAARSSDVRGYARTLPLCDECNSSSQWSLSRSMW